MKLIVLRWVAILLNIVCMTYCQAVVDDAAFPLICPNGLKGKGFSWYTNSRISFSLQSITFSICVQCQPEEGSNYDQIEICLANTEHILGGPF